MKFFYRIFTLPFIFSYASPVAIYLLIISLILIFFGCIAGLSLVPADYQQGNSFRIIYIHVPSAWMSLMIYMFMAISSFVYLVWKIQLAYYLTKASASIGAYFTFIALITGSIWGKPMWGTYWAWDARLTSELILLFIYIAYLVVVSSVNNQKIAAQISSILCLVGVVNIPIIYFSVIWWNTLHQGPSIRIFAENSIHFSMLWPLIINAIASKIFYFALMLINLKNQILLHHSNRSWLVKKLLHHD